MGAALVSVSAFPPIRAATVAPISAEVVTTSADTASTIYGPIGKWMIAPDGQPARWLGYQLGNRALREPINLVLLDPLARTPQEAAARLREAMSAAGYQARSGHSTGYQCLIGTQLYNQQPSGSGQAFSDGAWWRSNNHGRVFGPAVVEGGYLWTGAFSREDFEVISAMHHPYASFKVARDDVSAKLTAAGTFKRLSTLSLDNALSTPTLTTDDHDGQALVLVAQK